MTVDPESPTTSESAVSAEASESPIKKKKTHLRAGQAKASDVANYAIAGISWLFAGCLGFCFCWLLDFCLSFDRFLILTF